MNRPERVCGKWLQVISESEAALRCLKLPCPAALKGKDAGKCGAFYEHPPCTSVLDCPLDTEVKHELDA